MFRTLRTLALVAGILSFAGQVFAQDPVTERPNAPVAQPAVITQPQPKVPQPQTQASPANSSIWIGTEKVNNNGKLGFALRTDGKAIMIDAVGQVNGNWTQQGNEITIRFKNCVYQGTIQNGILAGRGTVTQGQNTGASWTFRVAQHEVIQNSEYRGHENLNGFGGLTFRFGLGNSVEMIDARSKVRGTFTVTGNQITLRFGNCVYVGQMQNGRITGQANYTDGQSNNAWTFEVQVAQK